MSFSSQTNCVLSSAMECVIREYEHHSTLRLWWLRWLWSTTKLCSIFRLQENEFIPSFYKKKYLPWPVFGGAQWCWYWWWLVAIVMQVCLTSANNMFAFHWQWWWQYAPVNQNCSSSSSGNGSGSGQRRFMRVFIYLQYIIMSSVSCCWW